MNKFLLFLLAILAFGWGCDKDEVLEKDYPRILTNPITITQDGNLNLSAEVINFGSEPIVDMGFVFITHGDETEQTKYSVEKGSKEFHKVIELDQSLYYYVEAHAFIETADFHSEGKASILMFKPEPPFKIFDFNPKTAGYGDTITIYGKDFENLKQVSVKLGSINKEIIELTDTTLNFVVKPIFNGSEAKLQVIGKAPNSGLRRKQFKSEFIYAKPMIFEEVQNVKFHDTIDISVENVYGDGLELQIANKPSEIISFTKNSIRTTIGSIVDRQRANIKVKSNGYVDTYNGLFIEDPIVSEFTVLAGKPGDTITIKGNGFIADKNKAILSFVDESDASTITAEREEFVAIVPRGIMKKETPVRLVMNFFKEELGIFIAEDPKLISFTPAVIENKSSIRIYVDHFESYSARPKFQIWNSGWATLWKDDFIEYHSDGVTIFLENTSVFNGIETGDEGIIEIRMTNAWYEEIIAIPYKFE
ncbi:IPT/TIG domain-containing protein [Portibacter marinus]|uniref:IPT/TIG domain-containing protein n=1 Tax=Portibacter marinus TaxID=2898660 RepID=UPI001F25BD80|nr:IPT/TIG domain-containing protein [Portibacter marinus]